MTFPQQHSDAPADIQESHPSWARLQAKAHAKGWTCPDTQWHGKLSQYQFVCAEGHTFSRQGDVFLRKGSVCAECKDQERLRFLQQWANSKGGRCLETQYLGRVPHRFECAQGHQWQTCPATIKGAKSWCPHCNHHLHGLRLRKDERMQSIQGL